MPVAVVNIKNEHTAFAPNNYCPVAYPIYLNNNDITIGDSTAKRPGLIIYRCPAAVTIYTHLL